MKSCISHLAFCGLLLACARAGEPAAPAAYAPHTQSNFTVTIAARNPFWPIGFVPAKKGSNVVAEDQLLRIPVELFRVSSIFLGDPSIAVINGKDYTAGQFLTIPTGTSVPTDPGPAAAAGVAKLLITGIDDGFVVVQYKTLVARIPISRK